MTMWLIGSLHSLHLVEPPAPRMCNSSAAALGPVFNGQIKDWPAHIETIATFWSQITGGPKNYSGAMPMKHLPLGIELRHLQAWLQLWEFNCSAHLPAAEAREMILLAHEIGRRLKDILRLEPSPGIPRLTS
jgi:hemoglobin